MGIGGHTFETLRHLQAYAGPLMAFVGGVPALMLRRRPVPPPAAGAVVKNRHFAADAVQAKPYRPKRERILAGDPVQSATYLFTSADRRFNVGTWTCAPGTWRIDFGEHEFIHILEGVVAVTDAGGETRVYRAGDSFVSPAGFSGTWEVIEPVTKHFVLYAEPPTG